MNFKFHVPTQSFGFLEIEGTVDELPDMEKEYNRYAEKPIQFKTTEGWETIKTFTGETILYNKTTHEYKDLKGNILIGGSTYAKQFEKPFNAEVLLPKCSTAWGVPESDIGDIWDMNRDTSGLLGSAIHLGLELAHKHAETGEAIKKNKKGQEENYALPKNPIVRKAVVSFIEGYGTDALPEVFVSNVEKGRVGQIDRLVVTDGKKCRVQDYKTSDMDDEKTKVYQHQLSYYASTLVDKGWTVEGLDVFYYDGIKWTKKSLPLLEVK